MDGSNGSDATPAPAAPAETSSSIQSDIRRDMEASLSEMSSESADTSATPAPERQEGAADRTAEAAPNGGDRPRDESGRFLPKEKGGGESPPVAATGTAPPAAGPEAVAGTPAATPAPQAADAPVEIDGKPLDISKPPPSWKPSEREAWGKVPTEARVAAHRRERETQSALQARVHAERAFQSYREQADPVMGTYNLLVTGSPVVRAQTLAQLFQSFGADLPEGLIGRFLGGQAPAEQGAAQFSQVDLERMVEAKTQEQLRQMVSVAQEQRLAAQIQAFKPQAEFWDDVLPTMQTLANVYSNDTIEQLYNRALAQPEHAEIRAIMEQRKAAQAAQTASASLQRSKDASSSIKSQPASGMSNGKHPDNSIRALLEASSASR